MTTENDRGTNPDHEDDERIAVVFDWCASLLGGCTIRAGDRRFHGRKAVWRVVTPSGNAILKVHRQRRWWEMEVHGLERWASAFGALGPELLGVHDVEPLALLVRELPGEAMPGRSLSASVERRVWREAGHALRALHELDVGEAFGPCRRDGAPAGPATGDPVAYIVAEFERWIEEGERNGVLTREALAVARAAQAHAAVFEGERPTPCHRDYGPANWLIDGEGRLSGIIDFEFAHWDVRVADFSRYPDWEWIGRPDLVDALFEGYRRAPTDAEAAQCNVARALYALTAIVWGAGYGYDGFAAEGARALELLAGAF